MGYLHDYGNPHMFLHPNCPARPVPPNPRQCKCFRRTWLENDETRFTPREFDRIVGHSPISWAPICAKPALINQSLFCACIWIGSPVQSSNHRDAEAVTQIQAVTRPSSFPASKIGNFENSHIAVQKNPSPRWPSMAPMAGSFMDPGRAAANPRGTPKTVAGAPGLWVHGHGATPSSLDVFFSMGKIHLETGWWLGPYFRKPPNMDRGWTCLHIHNFQLHECSSGTRLWTDTLFLPCVIFWCWQNGPFWIDVQSLFAEGEPEFHQERVGSMIYLLLMIFDDQ